MRSSGYAFPEGIVLVNPTREQLERYGQQVEIRRKMEHDLRVSFRNTAAETTDGHRVIVAANAKGPEDVDAIVQNGAEGIGLYRSEYAYLLRQGVYSEEEQFETKAS